jgi:AraC-like DNA-binding protein
MAPGVFEKITGRNRNELVEALDVIDHNAGKRNLARSKKNDFAQNLCGHQALDSLMNNPHDALFLEAKALELVALQLNQLEHLAGRRSQKQAVGRHVDKVTRACEILRKEMASPPTLPALSRRVGLNYNQLIQGFREMFGVSPFEYLRIIRLETARDLIASRECNVTEAAFTVGYSSLSHFTRTFREKFGVNPKTFAKEKKGFFPG